jgi:Glycosyl hydrolase family 26/Secretion system C-terminal sorting domain
MSKSIFLKARFISAGAIALLFLANAAFPVAPIDPSATPQAKALLNYIYSIYGKQMLTGQMHVGWGDDDVAYVNTTTGKYPAIMGIDFINEDQTASEVTKAIAYWKAGGIITAMYHEGAPTIGDGYDNAKATQPNFANLFVTGTAENTAMLSDWDRIAGHLKTLQDAGIPVIWRPFHECSGGWFWWDKSGGPSFIKLWQYLYTYMTKTKGIHNCLWFLGYCGSPLKTYDPGAGWYDMLGGDTYGNSGPFASLYNTVKGFAPSPTMPIALHECGTPPDPSQALSQNCMWAWFMVWDGSYIRGVSTTLLKSIYSNSVAITRDKLPNFATPVNYDLVAEKKTLDFEVRKTSEGFTVLAPFAGVNKISLFDVQGRIMTSAAATLTGANQYSVSIPGLSKGAYMVKVEGQGGAVDKKIMIGR